MTGANEKTKASMLQANSLAEYLQYAMEIKQQWSADVEVCEPLFRGPRDEEWELVPTFYRGGKFDQAYGAVERSMLVEFQQRARPHLSWEPRSPVTWMALAQHHALPTRLLDWTESALVALFFAVARSRCAQEEQTTNAAVWVLNRRTLNQPQNLEEHIVCLDESKDTWPSESSLHHFFPTHGEPTSPEVVAFSVVHVSRRLEVQRSAFTLFGSEPYALENHRENSALLQKIQVPSRRIDTMRRELEMAGVTYATLFPDLDGIARDVSDREERRGRERIGKNAAHEPP